MIDDLPKASEVLANLRSVVGAAGVIQMKDYGHGLGAVHVTLPHTLTTAVLALSNLEEWEYKGPGTDEDPDDDSAASSCVEFSRWVRLEPNP